MELDALLLQFVRMALLLLTIFADYFTFNGQRWALIFLKRANRWMRRCQSKVSKTDENWENRSGFVGLLKTD
jgi:hypothetical protein